MMAMKDIVLFAFEFSFSLEAGHGDIAHDFAENSLALVGQFDVFHTGTGHFGHSLDARHILGPYLGHSAAVRIVDAAGPTGPDTDESRFGRDRPGQGQDYAKDQE
jgi:hypothetical protein